jgi:hypothetical protein
MGKGANGAARDVDVCEPSSECGSSDPLAGNGLKVVDKRSDLAFADIRVNAGSLAELVDQVKKDELVLHRVGDESSAICVPLVGKL